MSAFETNTENLLYTIEEHHPPQKKSLSINHLIDYYYLEGIHTLQINQAIGNLNLCLTDQYDNIIYNEDFNITGPTTIVIPINISLEKHILILKYNDTIHYIEL